MLEPTHATSSPTPSFSTIAAAAAAIPSPDSPGATHSAANELTTSTAIGASGATATAAVTTCTHHHAKGPVDGDDDGADKPTFAIADADVDGGAAAAAAGGGTAADEAPDGGTTAWLVVLGSGLVQFVALGMMYSFGVYQTYYVHSGVGSTLAVSFVGSVGAFALPAFGVATGRLAERFGFQIIILVGSVVLFAGLLLASFSTQLWQLFLTQGVLVGAGSSLAYFPAVALPSQYFTRRRGLATGLAVAGAGVGGLVLAEVTQVLIDRLGVQWALRVSAFIALAFTAGVVPLLRPRIAALGQRARFDWSIVRDPLFIIMSLTCFFATFANLVPVYYMPEFALARIGLPASTGSALVSVYNGASAMGRIVLGLL
ncbi:hypothetical protein HK405_000381, partial [Cladochytrium tenue]